MTKRKRGEHGQRMLLKPRGVTKATLLAAARERMAAQRVGKSWMGGLIKHEAFLDMHYIKIAWNLRTNMEVVELALQHLAQGMRDGTVTLVEHDEAEPRS